MVAQIDTGWMDGGPPHPGLMDVKFGIVKTAAIVQYGHHELQGKVTFEIEALIALHRIGGGMSLGKGIARKTFDLSPDLGREPMIVAFLPAVIKKFALYRLEFFPGTELAAHPPPEHIGLPQVQARELVGHLEHILLVDHDPMGFRHD